MAALGRVWSSSGEHSIEGETARGDYWILELRFQAERAGEASRLKGSQWGVQGGLPRLT